MRPNSLLTILDPTFTLLPTMPPKLQLKQNRAMYEARHQPPVTEVMDVEVLNERPCSSNLQWEMRCRQGKAMQYRDYLLHRRTMGVRSRRHWDMMEDLAQKGRSAVVELKKAIEAFERLDTEDVEDNEDNYRELVAYLIEITDGIKHRSFASKELP